MKRIETQVPLKYLKRYALLPLITDIHLESFMSCSMIQCHNDLHPGGDLLVQVRNRHTRKIYEMCSKLTITTPERRQLTSFCCLYC